MTSLNKQEDVRQALEIVVVFTLWMTYHAPHAKGALKVETIGSLVSHARNVRGKPDGSGEIDNPSLFVTCQNSGGPFPLT